MNACFIVWTSISQGPLHRQLLFGCGLLFPILIYVKFYALDQEIAMFNLGLMCASSGIVLYASPLASLVGTTRQSRLLLGSIWSRPEMIQYDIFAFWLIVLLFQGEIIRTKSTECLVFPMCFANFIVATQWLLYGYLIHDLFVQVCTFVLKCLQHPLPVVGLLLGNCGCPAQNCRTHTNRRWMNYFTVLLKSQKSSVMVCNDAITCDSLSWHVKCVKVILGTTLLSVWRSINGYNFSFSNIIFLSPRFQTHWELSWVQFSLGCLSSILPREVARQLLQLYYDV